MKIYELITPSDPITFKATNDKIAIAAALCLGNGKAGCKDEQGNSLPTMYMFHPDPMPEIEKDLGCSLDDFIPKNRKELSECFLSFAYGSFSDRLDFDKKISSISNEVELKEFKDKHEDEERSSMSRWVKSAWQYGEGLLKLEQTA